MNNQLSLTQHLQELKRDLRRKHFVLMCLFALMGYFIFISSNESGRFSTQVLMFCVLVDTMSQQRLIDTLKLMLGHEQEEQ